MPTSSLLLLGPALALQPPVGWTQLGPDRAVLVPADPGRGELREIDVPGANADPGPLVAALATDGLAARVVARVADGTLNLDIGADQVARARAWIGSQGVTWYVVMANRAAAQQLDADALLTAALPRPGAVPALGGVVEVLEAGADGSLWDVAARPPAGASRAMGPWSASASTPDVGWAPNPALVGVWGANTEGLWGGKEMVLTLDTTGRLRIEERSAEGVQVTEGTWGTQGAQLRMAPLTGDAVVSAWSGDQHSLTFVWGGRAITLARRR